MDQKEILKHVDHTQLKAFATWEDIQKLCEEAIEYQTASCVSLRVISSGCMIRMEKRSIFVQWWVFHWDTVCYRGKGGGDKKHWKTVHLK